MSELPASLEKDKVRPWGFWATMGFTLIVLVASSIIQAGIGIVFLFAAIVQNPNTGIESFLVNLSSNGFYTAVAVIVAGILCTPLIVLFTVLRKGFPSKDYLALRMITKTELAKWLLFTGLLIAVGDTFTHFMNRPIVPDSVIEIYETAYFAPALYVALLVVAPVFEEVLVRGFMFQGIRYSRLGPVGAIVLTAFFWSILHLQYDAYNIAYIFVTGLLLGIARLKTNSTYITMAMHSSTNLIASIETLLVIHVFS